MRASSVGGEDMHLRHLDHIDMQQMDGALISELDDL
jgi:hypothetical protein